MKFTFLSLFLAVTSSVNAEDKPDSTTLYDQAVKINASAKGIKYQDTAYLNHQTKANYYAVCC